MSTNLNDSPELGPALLKIGYRTIAGEASTEIENERVAMSRLLVLVEQRLTARLVEFQRSHRTDLNQLDASISHSEQRVLDRVTVWGGVVQENHAHLLSEISRIDSEQSRSLLVLQRELNNCLDSIERRTLIGLTRFLFRKLFRRV